MQQLDRSCQKFLIPSSLQHLTSRQSLKYYYYISRSVSSPVQEKQNCPSLPDSSLAGRGRSTLLLLPTTSTDTMEEQRDLVTAGQWWMAWLSTRLPLTPPQCGWEEAPSYAGGGGSPAPHLVSTDSTEEASSLTALKFLASFLAFSDIALVGEELEYLSKAWHG